MGIRIDNIEDFIEEEVDTKSIFDELLEEDEYEEEDEYRRRNNKRGRYRTERELAYELEGIPVDKKSHKRKTRNLELSDDVFEVNKYDRRLLFGNEIVVTKNKYHNRNDNYKDKDEYKSSKSKNENHEYDFDIKDLDIQVMSLLDKANVYLPRYERKLEKKKKRIEEKRNNPNKRIDKENRQLKSVFDKLEKNRNSVVGGINKSCDDDTTTPKKLSFNNLTEEESVAVDKMFKWMVDAVNKDDVTDGMRKTIYKVITRFTKAASENNFLSWMQIVHSISSIITKMMNGLKIVTTVFNKLAEYSSKYIFDVKPYVVCREHSMLGIYDDNHSKSYIDIESFNKLEDEITNILY